LTPVIGEIHVIALSSCLGYFLQHPPESVRNSSLQIARSDREVRASIVASSQYKSQ